MSQAEKPHNNGSEKSHASSKSAFQRLIKRPLSWLPWILIAFLLYQRLPEWWQRERLKGVALNSQVELSVVSNDSPPATQTLTLPQKVVMVFWATWCPPCEIELKRIAAAVGDGEYDAKGVWAVSIGEDPLLVQKALQDRKYPFPVFVDSDSQLAAQLSIAVTPTIYFIEGGKIVSSLSGISPTLNWRIKRFLSE